MWQSNNYLKWKDSEKPFGGKNLVVWMFSCAAWLDFPINWNHDFPKELVYISLGKTSIKLCNFVSLEKNNWVQLAREKGNLCHAYPKSLATHPKDGIQGSYKTLEIAQWMKNRFTNACKVAQKGCIMDGKLYNGKNVASFGLATMITTLAAQNS